MWTLKNNVKIVLKRHGLVVTKETLAKNQSLANVILEDPVYNTHYGHNLVQVNATPVQEGNKQEAGEITIDVNIKKKADVLKQQEASQSDPLEDTALTFDNAGNDGMVLNVKERAPRSRSSASKRSKAANAKDESAEKSSDASAATSE